VIQGRRPVRHLGFYQKCVFTIPRPPVCQISNFNKMRQCAAEILMTKSRRGFQDAIVDRLYLRVGGGDRPTSNEAGDKALIGAYSAFFKFHIHVASF